MSALLAFCEDNPPVTTACRHHDCYLTVQQPSPESSGIFIIFHYISHHYHHHHYHHHHHHHVIITSIDNISRSSSSCSSTTTTTTITTTLTSTITTTTIRVIKIITMCDISRCFTYLPFTSSCCFRLSISLLWMNWTCFTLLFRELSWHVQNCDPIW